MSKICRKYLNCMQLTLNKLFLTLSLAGRANYEVVDGGRGDRSDMIGVKARTHVLDMGGVSEDRVAVIL